MPVFSPVFASPPAQLCGECGSTMAGHYPPLSDGVNGMYLRIKCVHVTCPARGVWLRLPLQGAWLAKDKDQA